MIKNVKNKGRELLSENKIIICALGSLHNQISREKLEPEIWQLCILFSSWYSVLLFF
jgi:hypothetical protein